MLVVVCGLLRGPGNICFCKVIPRLQYTGYGVVGGVRSPCLYVSLGRKLIRQAFARTWDRTYHDFFRCWKLFRVSGGLPFFLLSKVGVNYHASPFLAYIAHAWGSEGLTEGTIAGHLAVAKLFHRLGRGLELFLRHS